MVGWGETEERTGRGLCTITSVSKLNDTLIGSDWRLELFQGRTKDVRRRRDANNGSDTALKCTHQHIHTRTRQPEQLYPQRAGGEINAC